MNGSLWFKTGLDNTQLKRDVDQAGHHIMSLSDRVQGESKKMDSSFSGIGAGLATIGGTAAIGMLGREILETTAQYEKFRIVLNNTLGDTASTETLDMIARFAATTPFQLDEVTASFIKMANQGFVPTRDEMVKLGDVASSTGKSFDQLTEALLDAQTGQFERLKEFGIKASSQGDKVTFSFKEQQTTVDNTNSAIQAYILSLGTLQGVQGANAKISESLTGELSNLEDKLAAMYNQIGSANSGILYAGVGAMSMLIENYEEIGKVILGLVAVYGAYKATVIVVNAINSLQAQIAYQQMLANIGNTGATIRLTTAQGLQAVAASNLTRIQLALNKSMLANPYVLATMAVFGLVAAMGAYASSAKEAATEKEILNGLESEAQKNTNLEVSKLDTLKKILNDTTKGYGERKTALDKLKEIVPDYHADLTAEGTLINNNANALDHYVKKLVIAEKIKIASTKQTNATEAADDYKAENKDVLKTAIRKTVNGEELWAGEAAALEVWKQLSKEADNYNKVIDKLQTELVSVDAIVPDKPTSETPAQKKKRLAEEEKARKERTSKLADWQREENENQKKADEAELALLRSKISDKKDLIDLDYEQTLEAIKADEKLAKEKAKKDGQKFDSSTFDRRRVAADKQRITDKDLLDKEEDAKMGKTFSDMLEKYKTMEQKMLDLQTEYNNDSAVLSIALMQSQIAGDHKGVEATKAAMSERKKVFEGAMLEMNSQALKLTDFYTKFFDNSAKKGYSTLKTFAAEMNKVISEATFSKGADGKEQANISIPTIDESGNKVKKTVKITLEEFARLKEKLVEMDTDLEKRNPFTRLSKGFDDVVKAAKEAKNAKTDEEKAAAKDKLGDSLAELNKGFDDSMAVISEWGDSIGSVLGEGFDSAFKEIQTFVKGAADLGFGIGRIASGDVIGGITQTLSGVAAIYQTITGWQEKQAAFQRKLYLGEIEYQRALRDRNMQLEASTAYLAAFVKEQELLNWLVQKGFVKEGSSSQYSVLGNQYKDAMNSLKEEAKTYDELLSTIQNQGEADTGTQSTGSLSWERNTWSLKTYNAEMLKQADSQGLLVGKTKEWYDAWVASGSKIEELTGKVSELREQMSTLTLGSSFDDFLSGAADALNSVKGDVSSFANFTEDTIKKALLSSFKYQILSDAMRPLYNELSTKFLDSFTGDTSIDETWIADWSTRLKTTLGDDWAKLQDIFTKAGMDLGETTRSATQSGFASMSQDTGNELNGRFTALQGLTYEIVQGMKILQTNSAQALKHLAGIEKNTDRLESIENTLGSVKNGIDSINTKGINIKV